MYRGEQFDATLGQYHLRARQYDPASGRFASVDPLVGQPGDPATLHDYAYAWNDPVQVTDPTGEEGLISMMIGIGIGRGAIETGGAVNQGTNATNLHIANLVRQSMVLNYMISSLEEWRSIGGGLAKSVPYQRELVVDLYKTARKQSGFNNIRSKINKIFAMTAINSVGEMVIVNLVS